MRISGEVYSANTTEYDQLLTQATTKPEIAFHSDRSGEAYAWNAVTYDYDAGDTILLVQNTNSHLRLRISRIFLYADTATAVIIHCPVVATPTGTAVTAVTLNRDAANTPQAIAKADETTNTQANIVLSTAIQAAGQGHQIDIDGAIILGYLDSLAIDYVTNGAACSATIWGFYDGT